MPFSNLLRNHCTGDSLSVHIIMKTYKLGVFLTILGGFFSPAIVAVP